MAVLVAKILRLDARLYDMFQELEEEVERDERLVSVLEQSLAMLEKYRIQQKQGRAMNIRSRSGSIIDNIRQKSSRSNALSNQPISDESRFIHRIPRVFDNSYTPTSESLLPNSAIQGKLAESAASMQLPPRMPKNIIPKIEIGSHVTQEIKGMGSGTKAILLKLEQAKFDKTFQMLQSRLVRESQQVELGSDYQNLSVSPFEVSELQNHNVKAIRRSSFDRFIKGGLTSSTGGLNQRVSVQTDWRNYFRNSSKSSSLHLRKVGQEYQKYEYTCDRISPKPADRTQIKSIKKKDTIHERSVESSGIGINSMYRDGSKNSMDPSRPGQFGADAESRVSGLRNSRSLKSNDWPSKQPNVTIVPLGTPAEGMTRNNSGIREYTRKEPNYSQTNSHELEPNERVSDKVSSSKVSARPFSVAASQVPELPEPITEQYTRELQSNSNVDSTGGMAGGHQARPMLARCNYSLALETSPVMKGRQLERIQGTRISPHATLLKISDLLSGNGRQNRPAPDKSLETNFIMQSFDPFSSKLNLGSQDRDSNSGFEKEF
jgi:hypothetical protein